MNSKRRSVVRMLKVIVLLPLVYVLFLAVANSWNSSYKDSGLIFVRPQVPAESNAYYTLLKATNELYWPERLDRKLGDLSRDTNWDDSLAAEILETNRACLSSFEEAMKQPFLLVPELKSFDEDQSYLGGWKQLALVKSIQINSLHHAKNDQEALKQAFEILDFGQRLENSGGPIIDYLVGAGIKKAGLASIRQFAADTTLSESNLVQAIRKLDAFGPNREGLTNALKTEYTVQCIYLDETARGNIPGTTNSSLERVAISIGYKPFFSPRRTKMELAEADRFLLDNLSKSYTEIHQAEMVPDYPDTSTLQSFFSGNAMGNIFLEMLVPVLQVVPRTKCTENVAVTATQLVLALKIYDLQHGRLPDSLSELVPEFFPQVPLDDFDGKPFRYLPDKKIIYSVGPCLKDLGGLERKNEAPDYNLPFKIEF
jgi:hypothetical protein